MQKLGLNAVCYFKVGGVNAAGDWQPLSNLKDLTVDLQTGEADVTTRAANGWRLKVATLKEASIEGEMLWDTGDGGFTALKNAFFTNALIGILALDGPITVANNEGLKADCNVLSFTRDEKLEDALTVKIKLTPTVSTQPPQWVRTQADGSLVVVEN